MGIQRQDVAQQVTRLGRDVRGLQVFTLPLWSHHLQEVFLTWKVANPLVALVAHMLTS